jgi:hypothetical protein
MLDKDIQKLDLDTLETVYFMMGLYSDTTVFSLGYRRLGEMIEERKKLRMKKPKYNPPKKGSTVED